MGEKKTILQIEDRTRIKEIKFAYPELVNKNKAIKIIKGSFSQLQSIKEQLYKARDEVKSLEKKLALCEKEFKDITSNCTIEFETIEKEYITEELVCHRKAKIYS